ncbi:MAG TPA: hypothetical protein VGK58_23430, partial [Lacipirellulaceae bacterium]
SRLSVTNGSLINGPEGLLHFQTGGSGSRQFSGDLTNHGTVLIDRSTTFDKTFGRYLNDGMFAIAPSQTLTITDSDFVFTREGTYEQTGGVTLVNGTFISPKSVLFSGGQLTGSGTIAGAVENVAATVAPGDDVGVLTIQGNYTHSAGGKLVFDLAGHAAGQFDVLDVGGWATLAGTLDVTLQGGFVPEAGQQFIVLTANRVFDNGLTLTGAASSLFDLVVNSSNVILQAVSANLPGDFNFNGVVDAADYAVWRKRGGTHDDYNIWRANFGRTANRGNGAGASRSEFAVPEPLSSALALLALAIAILCRRAEPFIQS